MSTKLESNPGLLSKYLALKQSNNITQIRYVWIDGKQGLRNKTRTLNFIPKVAEDLPTWNFCGAGVYLSPDNTHELYLKPVRLYADPFRGGNNKMVMCENLNFDMSPHSKNTRHSCTKTMNKTKDFEPWFGIEQEYTLLDANDRGKPLGWPTGGFPGPQGPYYCGVGANRVFGRDIIEAHYRACLYAGINIAGENAEVMPSQWEYQIGPNEGVKAGDDLWMSRFLLYRVAEDFHIDVSFDPKLLENWNGAGAHINFSTRAMREKGGLAEIESAIKKLERNHTIHIAKYDPAGGKDNARRLLGSHETSSIDKFSAGVANRGASIRIPRQVADAGFGYLEDRRPASNMDPYVVTEQLVRTICLNE